MKRIILSGCNGKMGQMVAACVKDRSDCTIVAGIDITGNNSRNAFPVFTKPAECEVDADVIIDFSHPSTLAPLLAYAVERHIPAVIATTGLSSDQIEQIQQTSKQVPLFFTANMSLGSWRKKQRRFWGDNSTLRSSKNIIIRRLTLPVALH